MNINQLKAFLGDKPAHLGSENSVQNQLRDSGLQQAAALQANQTAVKADKFSSSVTFGARVFSSALNTTLEVNAKKPDFSATKPKHSTQTMFDFEEVAKNVLKFVGGAIKNAKNNGADDVQLSKLFEQATTGVLKGIKLAEKDLAGLMNEEIRVGIDSSKQLIDEGIANLKKEIFSKSDSSTEDSAQSVQTTTQLSVSRQQSAQLVISTKEGDEVTLAFEDFKQFEINQQILLQQQAAATNQLRSTLEKPDVSASFQAAVTDSEQSGQADVVNSKQNKPDEGIKPNTNLASSSVKRESTSAQQQNSVYYQSNTLGFSVSGELNEQELKAIGQLVADANSLADEFFNGDIEAAYNQALKLGFDEKELAGFALQLTKAESSQVVKAYETVSHYGQNETESEPTKAVKPVAQYLDKMLSVLEASRQQLKDGKEFDNMVNTLINRMGEVHTPDLISALNRFHSFNQKLLDNLPLTQNSPVE